MGLCITILALVVVSGVVVVASVVVVVGGCVVTVVGLSVVVVCTGCLGFITIEKKRKVTSCQEMYFE